MPCNYIPPSGNLVVFNAKTGYTPPSGNSIVLDVCPPSSLGIYPVGTSFLRTGEPSIENRNRSIAAGNISSRLVFGSHVVALRTRWISANGISPLSPSPLSFVSHYVRAILPVGVASPSPPSPWVSASPRVLSPPSIVTNQSSGHVVAKSRAIYPFGFSALFFGSRIIPEVQALYASGIASQAFGSLSLKNTLHIINPVGIYHFPESSRFGLTYTFNKTQKILCSNLIESGLTPPPIVGWTAIANRNRAVHAHGSLLSAFGYQSVSNNARPITPIGIDSARIGAGFISHKVRSITPDGKDYLYSSSWHVVSNSARVIVAQSNDNSVFGAPFVQSNKRAIKPLGIDTSALSSPMASYAIRHLSIESRYSISPPVIKMPSIDTWTKHIYPQGADSCVVTVPFVFSHINTIAPRWTMRDRYGTASVVNVTPEIKHHGISHCEFGAASVRLQWRDIRAEGLSMQSFGRALIADRRKRVSITGIQMLMIGMSTVTKTSSPPYSTQVITLNAPGSPQNQEGGNGIPPPDYQVGTPSLRDNRLACQGLSFLFIGSHAVHANSIRVEPGYFDHLIGIPTVSKSKRTIAVPPWTSVPEPSAPRLSPHTIWAVMDAPQQAKDNHPSANLHYVDGLGKPPGTIIGNHSISLKNRSLSQVGSVDFGVIGTALVGNKKTYVAPNGFNGFRSGWPSIPSTSMAEQFDSIDHAKMGDHRVGFSNAPSTIYAYAGIGELLRMGNSSIEHKNRTLSPHGLYATQMGQSKPGDTPFQWQGLRVGERVPNIISGFDQLRMGAAWVSMRVREISSHGFDAFVCTYQLEQFEQRMTVVGTQPISPPAQGVFCNGIDSLVFAAPNIKRAVHYIRPDGNSDQYRKGAPNA